MMRFIEIAVAVFVILSLLPVMVFIWAALKLAGVRPILVRVEPDPASRRGRYLAFNTEGDGEFCKFLYKTQMDLMPSLFSVVAGSVRASEIYQISKERESPLTTAQERVRGLVLVLLAILLVSIAIAWKTRA